jgi:hypothetical protein
MDQEERYPFDTIESAHEYVGLLCETIDEVELAIAQEIESPGELTRKRHLDALRLIDYKLKSLRQHFLTSRRLLNDLRTLRRYLLDERVPEAAPVTKQHTASRSESEPPTITRL